MWCQKLSHHYSIQLKFNCTVKRTVYIFIKYFLGNQIMYQYDNVPRAYFFTSILYESIGFEKKYRNYKVGNFRILKFLSQNQYFRNELKMNFQKKFGLHVIKYWDGYSYIWKIYQLSFYGFSPYSNQSHFLQKLRIPMR